MKITILILAFSLFLTAFCFGQVGYTVKGSVQDTASFSLPGALVKLKAGKDSIATSTDANGNFAFNNVNFRTFTLSSAYIGFESFVRQYTNEKNLKVLVIPVVRLKEKSNTLNEVVVSGVPPVRIKEDTVQFNASAFPVREGDAVEEVIRKLPGVSVDKDGNVTTQGKAITKIRVNGKDFFGADVATAIQSLPAEIVQNLQIIDDYGDQAKVTGIKSGEPEKILNINIQPDKKKGFFARGVGGMGNDNRYVASARGNLFKGDRQLSFIGTLNNTNLRGGAGNGVSNNRNASVNYKNEWGEKLSANGGYSFANRDNATESSSYAQTFYPDFTRFVNSTNTNNSNTNSHNIWGNIEFKPDSLNYLKLSPNFSGSAAGNEAHGFNDTRLKNVSTLRENKSFNNSSSLNAGTNLFFNHKFLKRGRNLSIFANLNFGTNDSFRDAQNDYTQTDSSGTESSTKQYQQTDGLNQSFRVAGNFSYSEPLSKTSFVDFRYNLSYSDTESKRDLSDVDPLSSEKLFNPAQSNHYQYQFVTNRIGLNLRKVHEKYNLSVGLFGQPTVLNGRDISRNVITHKETFNLVPAARFVYRFSKQQSLTARYNGRSNQPGFNQLQPLKDSTNLQNIIAGNPNLLPEFVHALNVDFNKSDWKSGNVVFASFSFNKTENKIVTSRVIDFSNAKQMTSYLNTSGFYNLNGNYSYAKSFAERRYTVTYSGGGYFNNNVSFSNGSKNIGKNLVFEQGLRFRLDLKDIVDAEVNANYSVNQSRYSLNTLKDRNTSRLVLGLQGRNYFFKDLTIGYNLSKMINNGYAGQIANPTIVNLFTEYRFLKGNMGTLRLNAVDILNENTGITRDVNETEIIDSRTNRLGRYFLLSFIFSMRKFG